MANSWHANDGQARGCAPLVKRATAAALWLSEQRSRRAALVPDALAKRLEDRRGGLAKRCHEGLGAPLYIISSGENSVACSLDIS